jgi:hypothetical protein
MAAPPAIVWLSATSYFLLGALEVDRGAVADERFGPNKISRTFHTSEPERVTVGESDTLGLLEDGTVAPGAILLGLLIYRSTGTGF